ncbi:uncharacterized protein B0P05DRAFT_521617 [Gilbertella persicaria]|uniref:uncharacterized protein n=1 Tax=Gilbertella persicaria TaxID=101096 RepID=UPI00221F1F72|nr:uncharacterized protein B0P05DRAFT_521617 [Gilbertella persicaria]KAI8098358.1 hypothetical protein B0P05DRAFT_521617 [Gilbertella persicaria]
MPEQKSSLKSIFKAPPPPIRDLVLSEMENSLIKDKAKPNDASFDVMALLSKIKNKPMESRHTPVSPESIAASSPSKLDTKASSMLSFLDQYHASYTQNIKLETHTLINHAIPHHQDVHEPPKQQQQSQQQQSQQQQSQQQQSQQQQPQKPKGHKLSPYHAEESKKPKNKKRKRHKIKISNPKRLFPRFPVNFICKAFAKSTVVAPPIPKKSKIVCQFFKTGSCSKFEDCEFSHDLSIEPCRFYFLNGKCNNNACPYSHAPLTEKTRQMLQSLTGPCRFYFLKGFCNNGDLCNFSHDTCSEQDRIRLEQEITPCKYYFSTGHCPKGDDCFYGHEEVRDKVK